MSPAAAACVGALVRNSMARLRAAGIATARQDAELLLARVLDTTRLALHLAPDRGLDATALDRLAALLDRRAAHEPLQYLLGIEEFAGVPLAVGPGVFIPRPETEQLVERALASWPAGATTIVDLCTGSGAIACAVATRIPAARVWAVELDPVAAGWARANVERLGLTARVRVVEGDLFAPLRALDLAGGVDLLLGNPPYIARAALRSLPPEVRDWEPQLALNGGPDGLGVIHRILAEAPTFARRGGRVLLEIGEDQGDRLRAGLAGDPRYGVPVFHRDLAGRERVLDVAVR